ncbi:DNA-binding LacI/PurR family transcriptional regulator [Rhizobium sp. BK661]|nr:DNA-binding LacI/PurR family transcriptional regulator [Rhizobium sp. BK661]
MYTGSDLSPDDRIGATKALIDYGHERIATLTGEKLRDVTTDANQRRGASRRGGVIPAEMADVAMNRDKQSLRS